MSVENMPNDQKETKQQVKTLEDIKLTDGISPEEAKQIDDITKKLKTDGTNEKINNQINNQKTTIQKILTTQFITITTSTDEIAKIKTDEIAKIKTDEIAKITTPEVAQAYINIITWISGDELNNLKTAIAKRKTALETEAKNAMAKESEQKAITLLSSKQRLDDFDNSEDDFNAVIDFLLGNQDRKEITKDSRDAYEQKLFTLMEAEHPNLTQITIGKASDKFGQKYPEGTRFIQWTTDPVTGNKENYTLRGDRKHVEGLKAQKANIDKLLAKDIDIFDAAFNADGKKGNGKTGMEYFDDDNGNFEGLRIYLENHDLTYVNQYLPKIISGINEYDAKNTKLNPIEAKNGYANVLTDYIISNPSLMGIYFDNLDVSKLNILGADEATRTNNYNRLLFKDTSTNTLNPEIQTYISSLSDSAKQAFMTKLGDIHEAITGKGKMNTVETIQEGFEKMVDQFGPMLFNILKFFGVSKATLYRWFPNAADKINEKFNKEYGLEEDEKKAVDTIANTIGKNDEFKRDYTKGEYPSATDLKTATTKKITDYITEIKNNSKYINISVLDNAVKLYNKDAETKVNIVDIVDITTTRVEGKKIQKISGIKEGQEKNFEAVMKKYLESDAPWSTIATTQKQINTEATYSNNGVETKDTKNEQGIDMNQAKDYLITTHKQLFQYLTASLFSNKDLGYVMTENGLKGEYIETPPPEPTITFTKDMYDNTGVTTKGAEKMIHEVIDMNSAPEKIKVTSGTKETIAVKKDINGTRTYVAESDKEKTNLTIDNRVTITTGDKIEAVQTSA